jgi:hypothetical protein
VTTVTTNLEPLLADLDAGFRETLEDRARAAQALAPRRSGRYAAGIRATSTSSIDGPSGAISADVPYAGALEHGADVGDRRGPHMAGQHPIGRAMESFGDVLEQKLKERSR